MSVTAIGPDRVRVAGGDGQPRTGSLKVSLGYVDSFVGEGQISYAGPGALARGRLALEIVAERLRLTGVPCSETALRPDRRRRHPRPETVGPWP